MNSSMTYIVSHSRPTSGFHHSHSIASWIFVNVIFIIHWVHSSLFLNPKQTNNNNSIVFIVLSYGPSRIQMDSLLTSILLESLNNY